MVTVVDWACDFHMLKATNFFSYQCPVPKKQVLIEIRCMFFSRPMCLGLDHPRYARN